VYYHKDHKLFTLNFVWRPRRGRLFPILFKTTVVYESLLHEVQQRDWESNYRNVHCYAR